MCPFLTGGSISPSRGPQILQASSPATDTAAVNAAYHTPYVYQPLKPRSVLRRRRPVELLVYLAHRGRRVRALQHGAQLREIADNIRAGMLPAIVPRFSRPRLVPDVSAHVLYTCAFSRSSRVAAQHGADAPSHGAPLAYPA